MKNKSVVKYRNVDIFVLLNLVLLRFYEHSCCVETCVCLLSFTKCTNTYKHFLLRSFLSFGCLGNF
uniref:Uncharacterized protein n=1 Tax=Glossina morsitans morsitans TaxID=37546 RepID=A0A1B0G492_GLOMM